MTQPIDINAWSTRAFLSIAPETERGELWCYDHINAEPFQGTYLSEHRYGPDILRAAHDAGLRVALDGRVADAPRDPVRCAHCPDGGVCAHLGACFYEDEAEGAG